MYTIEHTIDYTIERTLYKMGIDNVVNTDEYISDESQEKLLDSTEGDNFSKQDEIFDDMYKMLDCDKIFSTHMTNEVYEKQKGTNYYWLLTSLVTAMSFDCCLSFSKLLVICVDMLLLFVSLMVTLLFSCGMAVFAFPVVAILATGMYIRDYMCGKKHESVV